jgi:hypothetical protein
MDTGQKYSTIKEKLFFDTSGIHELLYPMSRRDRSIQKKIKKANK